MANNGNKPIMKKQQRMKTDGKAKSSWQWRRGDNAKAGVLNRRYWRINDKQRQWQRGE
jgi:hypothetical protein